MLRLFNHRSGRTVEDGTAHGHYIDDKPHELVVWSHAGNNMTTGPIPADAGCSL